MTARTVTARPVSIYAQPDRTGITATQQRQRQVAGVFEQLGVNLQKDRERRYVEVAEAEQRRVRQEAVGIANDADADLRSLLDQPEYATLTAEMLEEQPQYQEILSRFDVIGNKQMISAIKDQYREKALGYHGQRREQERVARLDRGAAKAQLGASQKGASRQLSEFENSIAAGADRASLVDNLILAGGGVSVTQLKELREQGDWTPEELAKFDRTLTQASKAFSMEAAVAYKLAGKVQDRTERAEAYVKLAAAHGENLSNDQKANVIASLQVLKQEIDTENWARQSFGHISVKAMAEGTGMPAGYRKLSVSDLKELQNDEIRKALKRGDIARVTQAAALPGDEPEALKEYFSQAFGSLASVDPSSSQQLQRAMTYAQHLKDNLGWPQLKAMMNEDQYAAYVDIAGVSEFKPMAVAIEDAKQTQALLSNGKLPTPKKWSETRRSVVTSLLDNPLNRSWYDPRSWFEDSPMNRASAESLLNPHFKRWQVQQLSEDEIRLRASEILKDSAWGGYLNGGTLGAHMDSLTQGVNGNPYGERNGEELLTEYKAKMFEKLKESNPDLSGVELLIGNNPNQIFLLDKGGLAIPSSITSPEEITEWIKENIPNTKQEILNERGAGQADYAFERLQGGR